MRRIQRRKVSRMRGNPERPERTNRIMKAPSLVLLTLGCLALPVNATLSCLAAPVDKAHQRSLPAARSVYYVDGAGRNGSDANPGTAARPFRTIQHAADAAGPGDLVLIRPGIYHESILLRHGGKPGRPIVFQATERHGATVSGLGTDHQWLIRSVGSNQNPASLTAQYITLRGLVFRDAAGPSDWNEMVTMATGWRLEDCVVEGSPGHYADAIVVRGDDCALIRVITQDNGMNGMSGVHTQDTVIQDCILRRNNRLPELPGGNCGACKFLFTTGLRVEGVISYDNFGSGWWLDWDNRNFSITDSTFFGNHAGIYRYPRKDRREYNQVRDEGWAGAGVWSEGNPGPGLIQGNTIYSNLSAGIGVMESGFEQPIVVRHNTIVDCDRGIELRAMNRGTHILGRVIIKDNLIKDWRTDAIGSSLEDTIRFDHPADQGIAIDRNSYDPGPSHVIMTWFNKADKRRFVVDNLNEARTQLGVETHGAVKADQFIGPLIPVKKTALSDWTPDRRKIDEVPSRGVEKITIDRAIRAAASRVGDSTTIPVFGRKKIVQRGREWIVEVYDLDARYVRLILPSKAARDRVETAVLPYASIRPSHLRVKLTRLTPYDVEGVFVPLPVAKAL